MDEWSQWFRDTAGGVIGQWSAATYAQPATVAPVTTPATSTPSTAPDGSRYLDGQPAGAGQGLTISKDMLILIGVGLAAVMLLKGDD